MAPTESEWALTKVNRDAETWLIRKNLQPDHQGDISLCKYLIYLTFACKNLPTDSYFMTKEDADTLYKIEEEEIRPIASASSTVLVAVVTAPRVKDFVLYSSNPERFLADALYFRSKYQQFDIGCQYSEDPDWTQHDDLPPSNVRGKKAT